MSDAIRQHTIKYPHARTSTVRYLVAREEMTKRLQEEVKQARRERDSLVAKFKKSRLWPSWVWRW